MIKLQDMLQKNAADSVGAFLSNNINADADQLMRGFQQDPKLANILDGKASPKELLTQFAEYVKNQKALKNKLSPRPGDGVSKKLVDDFEYVPTTKPRPQ